MGGGLSEGFCCVFALLFAHPLDFNLEPHMFRTGPYWTTVLLQALMKIDYPIGGHRFVEPFGLDLAFKFTRYPVFYM